MLDYFSKNKQWLYPLILFVVFTIFIIISWGKWGHLCYDCFRELILPQGILEGKVLYSEIYVLYPPLAYQFNAFLFSLFGNSLNVAYTAGIINTLVILSALYVIINKFSNNFLAFLTVLTTMFIFVFRVIPNSTANWIFPYSYSFIYAFSSIILALAFYLNYKKTRSLKFLFISILFTGLSLAFKLDFFLFILLPLYDLLKTKSIKNFIVGAIIFFIPSFISYSIFLFSGGTIQDLYNQILLLLDFANSPSVKEFNKMVLCQTINIQILQNILISFVYFITSIGIIALSIFFLLFCYKKIKYNFIKISLVIIITLLLYVLVLKQIAIKNVLFFSLSANFVFLSYLLLIISIIIIVLKYKIKNYTIKDKFFIILCIAGFIVSYRICASILINYIGNFIIIIYWSAFIYLLFEVLPQYFKKIDIAFYKKILTIVLILYSLTYFLTYLYNIGTLKYKLPSSKGTYYTNEKYYYTTEKSIEFAKKNIKNNQKLLVVDEGELFNYFADAPIYYQYYSLIPHAVDALKEENIINGLKENMPDFIYISNNVYMTKKGGYWGIDYANKIFDFILENYNLEKHIKNPNVKNSYEIAIYKKINNKNLTISK